MINDNWARYKLKESILEPRFFVDMFFDGGACEPLTVKQQQDVNLQWCVMWGLLQIGDCALGGCVRRTDFGEECEVFVEDGDYFLGFPLLDD